MEPLVGEPFAAAPDVHVIPTYWPVPGAGVLPMNAFLIHAAEPVLVDSGVGVRSAEFIDALASLIDLPALRWIWLTHDDRDHTGSLLRLLELAPRARVATPFFAVGRMLPGGPFPLDRLHVVNAGDRLDVGDRTLTAWRPPLYDSPATVGLLDTSSGVLVSSDCFGAPLPTLEEARVTDVGQVAEAVVTANQVAWATVDSPWVTTVDRPAFNRTLDLVERVQPTTILSSHLPPARGRTAQLVAALRQAPAAEAPPATTQAELEALLAAMAPDAA